MRDKSKRDDDDPPPSNPTGRGTKSPLLPVAVERDGDVFTRIIPTHGRKAISEALKGVLDASAVVID